MKKGQVTQLLSILKRCLSRLARHSARLFFGLLSLLRRAAGHLKLGTNDKIFITRSLSGALPRSQGTFVGEDVVPICSSLLPPGQMGLEVQVAGELQPLSDDPYARPHSRPLQGDMVTSPLEINTTTAGYPSTTETDGLHQGSMTHLRLSLQTGESLDNNRTFLEDSLQESSSPQAGLHETSRTLSRPRGYIDDAHSIDATSLPSMRHLRPGVPYSQYASASRFSVSTGYSITRSISGSESRRAAYRVHLGPVHSRPNSVRSSIADMQRRSSSAVSLPWSLPGVPAAVTDPGFDHHVHYTAPPGSENDLPGLELVIHEDPQIFPMVASGIRRYESMVARDTDDHHITIPAMTTTFPAHDVPNGWTTVVHPEGPRYFVNQETRTFTEVDICNADIFDDIEYYTQYLWDALQKTLRDGNLVLDMGLVDLVVEPKATTNDSVVCCYYFVNHRDRCLFWLDDFNPEEIISECKGVKTLSHIGLAIQAQYWRCCHYFPSLCPVTQDLVDELKDMLIHATCDHLTSDRSSMAFDTMELRDHLSVVDRIKIYPPADQGMQRCHAAIVVGRIMYAFSHNHFLNYYGENCVRLFADQTVHGWAYKLSPSMVVLAPLLFFDCVTQVYELNRVFVDEVACTARWNTFTSKLNGQLQDSNLLATVLLTTNVGFLATNSIDKGGRNAIQMASYMSLVASMGSMIVGLLLASHNRSKCQDTQFHTTMFLSGLHDRKHGLEKLGIIYSLPRALLIWGMIFFFAAFAVNWWSPGDQTSRAVVGAVILVVFVTILCSIWITREPEYHVVWGWVDLQRGRIRLSRLADALGQAMEFMGIQRHRAPDNRPYVGRMARTPRAVGLSQSNAEVEAPMQDIARSTTSPRLQPEIPSSDDRDNHPDSSTSPIRSHHPDVSVHSLDLLHNGNSVQPPSNSGAGLDVLSGVGSVVVES